MLTTNTNSVIPFTKQTNFAFLLVYFFNYQLMSQIIMV